MHCVLGMLEFPLIKVTFVRVPSIITGCILDEFVYGHFHVFNTVTSQTEVVNCIIHLA